MYMNFDLDKDFVFTTDKNGCLKGGGFKIESSLLNETMNNNIQTDGQKGGNLNIINGFKNLVVPAGLFYSQKKFQKNKSIHYESKNEEINEEIYDKLLNMLEPEKRKLHSRKTKSKKENKKRKSRKIKK